jgi:anti-sigma B factor antagonist
MAARASAHAELQARVPIVDTTSAIISVQLRGDAAELARPSDQPASASRVSTKSRAWVGDERVKENLVPRVPFEMESAHHGETGRLTLVGELDIATVPRVEAAVEAILRAGTPRLTVDLSRLGFIDSSGLRLFIVLQQRASAEGWKLALVRPEAQALKVFRVSGVEDHLPFVEDASAA